MNYMMYCLEIEYECCTLPTCTPLLTSQRLHTITPPHMRAIVSTRYTITNASTKNENVSNHVMTTHHYYPNKSLETRHLTNANSIRDQALLTKNKTPLHWPTTS